jgi:hypothetical protein
MINSSEYFEKYISHKDIKLYFDNNKDKTQMKLFTSYYGNITVNGRKTSHQEDYEIEPVEIILIKKKQLIDDPFGNMNKLMEGLNEKYDVGLSLGKFKKPKPIGWQPLPENTITHFDWQVELKIIDSKIKIDNRVIERLKFFPTMDQAKMNYIKMMEFKFKKLGIFEAFDKFNKLCNTLGKKYPEEFI